MESRWHFAGVVFSDLPGLRRQVSLFSPLASCLEFQKLFKLKTFSLTNPACMSLLNPGKEFVQTL